jgi:xanthine dehydrogenase accessory factor
MTTTAEQLTQLARTERRVAMATLVAARGGSPRPLGAKLFVGEGGRLLGSVSIGGCVDARVMEHGERLLSQGCAQCVTVAVDDAEALELGLTCGAEFDLLIEPVNLQAAGDPAAHTIVGAFSDADRLSRAGHRVAIATDLRAGAGHRALIVDGAAAAGSSLELNGETIALVSATPRSGVVSTPAGELFVERIVTPNTLVVVGASDVAAALTRFARELGFRAVVIDGRPQFATKERFAAAEVLVGMPSELVQPYLDDSTFLVLAAHEYKYELPILRSALRSPIRYVGMLSGRKRAANVRKLLRDDGFSEAEVARLRAPIGLDIGGREPEEIALSIAAELIAVREGKPIANRDGASP